MEAESSFWAFFQGGGLHPERDAASETMEILVVGIPMVDFADLLHGKINYPDSHGEFRRFVPWEKQSVRFAWCVSPICSMEKQISEICMVNFADLLHGKNNYQDSHGKFCRFAPWENQLVRFPW